MADPVLPSSGVLSPLGLDSVRLAPGFWGDRVALNRDVIIGHCAEWMEKEGWIGNFRGRPRRGREFSDSEIYKLLEAMAWADHPGFAELAATVAQAQESDGYLNTRWGGDRYTDLEWGHELYCFGHLIQAGVARLRGHGEDDFTTLVRRAADHVCDTFMEGARTDGHPEIEMALVELYRVTGADRYLEMARRFVERRGLPALGRIPFGSAYFQDDLPVRQARVFRGHAVRALYLACGAVDVAVETGDRELLEAVAAQWERTVARRTHLTGGMGSRHADEAFGADFELPPDRAYSETCASIASIMLAHRLLLATGEARYADLAERTLYNVLATSPALDGRSFFYSNPLQVRTASSAPVGVNPGHSGALRSPWFEVSCCPSNVARTFASLAGYFATSNDDGVQIHHYTPAEIRGSGLALQVDTGYPWTGTITVRVLEPATGRISLRIPPWARQAAGYLTYEGPWQADDEIKLDLPMSPRWTLPDRRIDALRGTAAVERGPLVYCAESPADEPELARAVVRLSPPVERTVDGIVELEVEATLPPAEPAGWPYHPLIEGGHDANGEPNAESTVLRLVPYHRWGNRGPATMRIWLPAERA